MNIVGFSVLFIVFVANEISSILTGFSIAMLVVELGIFSLTALSDPGIVFESFSGDDVERSCTHLSSAAFHGEESACVTLSTNEESGIFENSDSTGTTGVSLKYLI